MSEDRAFTIHSDDSYMSGDNTMDSDDGCVSGDRALMMAVWVETETLPFTLMMAA